MGVPKCPSPNAPPKCPLIGYQFEGERYDAGDKFGFLQANIAYALKRPDIAPKLLKYMLEVVNKNGLASEEKKPKAVANTK
jgi:hypothetical protein